MFFFISGVNTKSKDIGSIPNSICPSCGAYCSMQVSSVFESLHLFFVPLFKWGRKYFVTMPCCNAVYELDREEGMRFEKGEIKNIDPSSLRKASGFPEVCPECGAALQNGANFCSRCGFRIR
ncbi:MAG: zinc ribbon domain-containing protein [Bacillota bacterium]|nr:zinc ribbon domain-containing protein [Bacillota bacterium]